MKECQLPFETLSERRRISSERSRFGIFTTVTVALLLIGWYSDIFSTLSSSLGHESPWPLGKVPIGMPAGQASSEFEWSSINASSSLEFTSCFSDLECAKLELPLDYFTNTYASSTINLAVVKVPAKIPVTDPRYGGPILLNPGGPGGSGVFLAVALGKSLQTVVDSPDPPDSLVSWKEKNASSAKYFDIISFDPRGVGNSEPRANCLSDFPSAWSWTLREDSEGLLDSSNAALGRLWSMNHAFGASCYEALETEDGPDIKQYLTTASVARDMLEITERHAEYVHKLATKLITHEAANHMIRPELPRFTPGESKLQYWGFSYGTFLGNTFASMFPSRVGRMVLDGVVDAAEYLSNLGYLSLHDTEKTMDTFYEYCASAGEPLCPLAYEPDGTFPATIKARVQSIIRSLYHNPLPVSSRDGPDIVTYSDLKKIIFSSLYSPSVAFPFLSPLLHQISAGKGSDLAQALRPMHIYTCPLNPNNSTTDVTAPAIQQRIAMTSILCSDGSDVRNTTVEEFTQHLDALTTLSPSGGALWASLTLKCIHWPIRAKYRFTGPFGGKTSSPILWVGNTADPVTPLVSARKMRKRFEGSGLVVVEGAGHCSMAVDGPAGICALWKIRGYFQGTEEINGKEEVFCDKEQSDRAMSSKADSEAEEIELKQELELQTAGRKLARHLAEQSGYFGFKGLVGSHDRMKLDQW